MSEIAYNPFDPELRRNPWPIYTRLREEAPLYPVPGLGFSVLSRYDDVLRALKDPRSFSSRAMADLFSAGGKATLGEESSLDGETLIGTDPPVHTRLRKIVNRGFTPRRIAALEPRIREVTAGLVDRIADKDECDLVSELGTPLPVTIIAEILGVDPERHEDFKRWSDDFMMLASGRPTPEQAASIQRTDEELNTWVDEIVEERRARPRDDVISALLAAEASEDVMTAEEIGNLIVILLIAGNETTTNLISNGMLALLDHPEQLAALRADPRLLPGAIEELLRFCGPIQIIVRRATRDLELAGGKLREGDMVGLLLGSANRDERQFAHADRLDLRRDARAHLAFGLGTHFCVGAPLARLEARVAFELILQRLDGIERVPEQLEFPANLIVRGPERLRLRFTARAA